MGEQIFNDIHKDHNKNKNKIQMEQASKEVYMMKLSKLCYF